VITGLPTAPLASRLINQRAAAPWITLPRRASLIDSKILSKQTEPALRTGYRYSRPIIDIGAEHAFSKIALSTDRYLARYRSAAVAK